MLDERCQWFSFLCFLLVVVPSRKFCVSSETSTIPTQDNDHAKITITRLNERYYIQFHSRHASECRFHPVTVYYVILEELLVECVASISSTLCNPKIKFFFEII